MSKRLVEMAAEIVQGQVASSAMSSDEIVTSLKNVFAALVSIKNAETQEEPIETAAPVEAAPQAMDPKDSIQENKIICLECAAEMRQLTAKHLGAHGLTPRDYKKKYGFPMKQPLSAKALTKARSKAAKKRGLPENLMKFQEARKQSKVENLEAAIETPSGEVPASVKPEKKRSGGRKKAAEA